MSLPRFTVIGTNHRSSSLLLRDQLFIDDRAAVPFLTGLKGRGLHEALVLSTCDRVEVWASHPDARAVAEIVCASFSERAGLPIPVLTEQLYDHTGPAAIRHAFSVTSSLDSLVVGEPHVFGQVKTAHRLARDAGACGPELETVLQAAFATAKRVRSDTRIGEGPVSIAAATVQLARDLHGDLSKCRGLLVGVGDMGELVAESLLAAGLSRLTVTAPHQPRADALAQTLNAHVVAFENLAEALVEAEIAILCIGSRTVSLSAATMSTVLKKRRRKPMFVVDAGIPGDVEPLVNRVDGAFLYDLSDLERVALAGRAGREQAARQAVAMVDDELAEFLRGRAERAAVPAIVALRLLFEKTRETALVEAEGNAEEATRLLINRLLHAPSETLKGAAATGADWQGLEKTLQRLFRLES